MRFTFNLEKKYIAFLLFIALISFAIAQTPNPGHLSDNIWVPASVSGTAQSLNSFLDWLNDKVGEHETEITALQGSASGSGVAVEWGQEIYLGQYNYGSAGFTSFTSPEYSLNGISRVRFEIISTAGSYISTGTVICGSGNPVTDNAWTCTRTTNGQQSILAQSNGCPPGVPSSSPLSDWVTFTVVPRSAEPDIFKNGFSSIYVEFCDGSPNSGSVTVDIYATPYIIRTSQGYRIYPFSSGISY